MALDQDRGPISQGENSHVSLPPRLPEGAFVALHSNLLLLGGVRAALLGDLLLLEELG